MNNPVEQEMKPCQCGNSDLHLKETAIRCFECNIVMPGVQGKEELIKAWNTRPLEDQARREALEEVVKHFAMCSSNIAKNRADILASGWSKMEIYQQEKAIDFASKEIRTLMGG